MEVVGFVRVEEVLVDGKLYDWKLCDWIGERDSVRLLQTSTSERVRKGWWWRGR